MLRTRATGTTSHYSFTLAEIYEAVNDLEYIADEQAEQELDEGE